jgi:hypothetical protein
MFESTVTLLKNSAIFILYMYIYLLCLFLSLILFRMWKYKILVSRNPCLYLALVLLAAGRVKLCVVMDNQHTCKIRIKHSLSVKNYKW